MVDKIIYTITGSILMFLVTATALKWHKIPGLDMITATQLIVLMLTALAFLIFYILCDKFTDDYMKAKGYTKDVQPEYKWCTKEAWKKK